MLLRMTTIKLHGHPLSGHSHRVALFLSLLGLPFERIDVDLVRGAQKTTDFLAKNAFGQVPVLEDGSLALADSNAILVYLALRYDPGGQWLPRDPAAMARVQRWLSVAAGPLASGPGALRAATVFKRAIDRSGPEQTTAQLFGVLEQELSIRSYLAGNTPTIADVALYTYTAHAPEGGVSLAPYPHIRMWIGRIEALSGYVTMQRSPARV